MPDARGPIGTATGRRAPSKEAEARPAEGVSSSYAIAAPADALLEDLSRRLRMSKADALLMAIALLKAAADARYEGKVIGAANSADVLDTDFVGF